MSSNRKATIAKRQRESDQRERVKQREQRRVERRARIKERAESGVVAPTPVPIVVDPVGPVLGVDGPRSVSELRAARAAIDEERAMDRIVDPDEIEHHSDPDELI